MVLSCGHVVTAMEIREAIGVLKRAFKDADGWCGRCGEWRGIRFRKPTAAQIVGIETLPIPDDCPF